LSAAEIAGGEPPRARRLRKYNPGKLNAGTVGTGSHAHITLELIKQARGTSIAHSPTAWARSPARPDFGRSPSRLQYIPTSCLPCWRGRSAGSRSPACSARGIAGRRDGAGIRLSGFEAIGWNALVAPAGTPREIIDKVNAVVNAFLKSDSGRQQLEKMA